MDYEDRYAEVLPLAPDRKVAISELYLFRGWTTLWAFRLLSPNREIGEKITYQAWNESGTLGRIVMEAKYNITIPDSSVVESRWQAYDEVYLRDRTPEKPIPDLALGSKAAWFCRIHDPTGIILLTTQFLAHFVEIKEETIRLWSAR